MPTTTIAGCKLPAPPLPLPTVNGVKAADKGPCSSPYAMCLDEDNVGKLGLRDARLRNWIKFACAQCGCGDGNAEGGGERADGGAN
jgi:hypothetical protein